MIILMRSLLTLLLFGAPAMARAATIFSEDFEVAAVSNLTGRGWVVSNNTDADSNPVMAIVNCPGGRSGKCLRMQYFGPFVSESFNANLELTYADTADVYERYYAYFEAMDTGQPSGFNDVTSKQHYWNTSELPDMVTLFRFGGDELAIANQTATNHLCPNASTDVTCSLVPNLATVNFTYGTWRCVETHAGPTSVDIWVDGVQTVHYDTTYWVPASTWHELKIYRQAADNQYRYEDDFVLSTTRVGCAGGGGGGSTAGGGLDF